MDTDPRPPDDTEVPFLKNPPGMEISPKKDFSRETQIRDLIYSEEEKQKIKCGFGFFKPQWLQVFARKEVLIVAFSLGSIVQRMSFSYTISVISTLEKRFRFTSVQTGIILAGNDISAIMFAPFLGYYLNYRHRPRWLGLGMIMTAISCFLSALPHFIYGSGEEVEGDFISGGGFTNQTEFRHNSGRENLCGSGSGDTCSSASDQEGEFYLGPLIIIFISQFVVGISMSIFYSIGVSYVDDNISKKSTSFYYSFYLLLRTLGPILGFLLGGKCLEYWVVPSQPTNLSPKDPRWLGAWWIGFLVIGSGLLIVGTSFSLLPFKLPATLERERRRLMKLSEKKEEETEEGHLSPQYLVSLTESWQRKVTKPTLRNMIKVTKKLFTNKIWAANIFNTSVFICALSGYNVFQPKYLENQFRKSASEANYYVGMATLIATCLGTLVSAIVLRWVRPGARFVTGYNIFVTLLGCFAYLMLMLIGCPQLDAVGSPSSGYINTLKCSSDCGCSAKFSPVCSEDNSTLYYSPCYAGCRMADTSVKPTVYSDCTCIANASASTTGTHLYATPSTQTMPPFHLGTAIGGYCPEECGAFIYYVVLQIIIVTVYATGKIGSTIIHLRAVEDEDKGISIGMLEVFLSLFGFIPGPLIMGQIIDSSCIIWEEKCGVRGNCWLYDNGKFRILLHSVAAGLVLLSVLGDLVMFKFAHLLDLYGERETAFPLFSLGEDAETKPEERGITSSQAK